MVPAEPRQSCIWRASSFSTWADTGGRRELPGGAGRVEDPVVRAAEKLADAHAAFVTRDRGRDERLAARCRLLARGEHRGENDRPRMQHRAVVQVVLLDEMRRRAVDQRGEERRAAAARGEDFARALRRPHERRELLDRDDRPRVAAGQRGGEPVEKKLLGARDHFGGQRLVAYGREKLGQRLGGIGILGVHWRWFDGRLHERTPRQNSIVNTKVRDACRFAAGARAPYAAIAATGKVHAASSLRSGRKSPLMRLSPLRIMWGGRDYG